MKPGGLIPYLAKARWPCLSGYTLGLLLLTACGSQTGSEPELATQQLCLVTAEQQQTLVAELAVTPQQREAGLMHREALDFDAGMLFIYPTEAVRRFWMYQTPLPLDIAFFDRAGELLAIETMEPCTAAIAHLCPRYGPEQPFQYALEVNAGYFHFYELTAPAELRLGDCETALEEWREP